MFDETVIIHVDLVDNILPKDVKVDFAYVDVQWMDVECL
jgi:hypothetical protein